MGNDSEIDRWVAERLGTLRRERGLTLTALAELSGLSAPHLSRLEKAERQPSIGTLLQLARVYGVSVGELVEDRPPADYHLLRSADATVRNGPDGRYTVLSGPQSTVSVMRLELPAATRTRDAHHAGEEWLQVLAGSAAFVLGGEPIDLDVGDAIQFDSARPHRIVNGSGKPLTVLIVSTAATAPAHHPIPPAGRRR